MLHPALLKQFDVDGPVAAVELFLDAIPGKRGAATFARAAYAPPGSIRHAAPADRRDYDAWAPD